MVENLTMALAPHLGSSFSVIEADLLGLQGADRIAALDAIVAGEPSPYVVCDGRLLCAGSVDVQAVLRSLGISSVENDAHSFERT